MRGQASFVACAAALLFLMNSNTQAFADLDCDQPIYIEETRGNCPEDQRQSACGCVTQPKLTKKVTPVYPTEARKQKVKGKVVLQAIVTTKGQVTNIKVVKADPPGFGFANAATEAVSRWRYAPFRIGEEKVAVRFTVVVGFDFQ